MRGEEDVGGKKKTGGSLLLIDGNQTNFAGPTKLEGVGGSSCWGRMCLEESGTLLPEMLISQQHLSTLLLTDV